MFTNHTCKGKIHSHWKQICWYQLRIQIWNSQYAFTTSVWRRLESCPSDSNNRIKDSLVRSDQRLGNKPDHSTFGKYYGSSKYPNYLQLKERLFSFKLEHFVPACLFPGFGPTGIHHHPAILSSFSRSLRTMAYSISAASHKVHSCCSHPTPIQGTGQSWTTDTD